MGRLYFKCVWVVFLCLLAIGTEHTYAKDVKIEYLGKTQIMRGKISTDTIREIDLFNSLNWEVQLVDKNGVILKKYFTDKPDTLSLNSVDTVKLKSDYTISSSLLFSQVSLVYSLTGSVLIAVNGENLLATGVFANNRKTEAHHLTQFDITNFVYKDTNQSISIYYIPHHKERIFDLSFAIGHYKYIGKSIESKYSKASQAAALGFYYMAFGIIFLIFFIFHKEKSENLYFSLFCICASLALLWTNMYVEFIDNNQHYFLSVLSLEFLSIFFAKVIKNKEKSKIPLFIIISLTLLSFFPFIRYNYSTILGINQHAPVLMMTILVILFVYTSFSSIYYLVQGFGQKRWEARAMVIICSIAFVMFIAVPAIFILVFAANNTGNYKMVNYLSKFGFCIYPLSAAIVLGRKNGLDQKQLLSQIESIEKLSEDNLVKEREKKQILEGQKAELEQKVNERTTEVMQQKKEIEIKNKAITDNINYAQRIQSAILPDISLIYKALSKSFILFKPKDIVSGDFYAFAEKNDRVIVIAGDCTGHGVSGAFMSMIASSLLNHIINEKGMELPSDILNQLNKSVIETLRQGENESNDGMDISICSYDLVNMELHYSGANRPLWLIRDGVIDVIKPDKFPIGGLQVARDRTFTNNTLNLMRGDTVYIFTDGYADQFGGDKGKKMMTAKFKEILISIQAQSMQEQEQHLDAHFNEWKGSHEQVDDVLVIGVRV